MSTGSTTDLYVLHMIEAALSEYFEGPVYATQYKLSYSPITKVEPNPANFLNSRPNMNAMRGVHAEIFFALPSASLSDESDKAETELPRAKIDLLLVSEGQGRHRWEMQRMHVNLRDLPTTRYKYFERHFDPSPANTASAQLKELSSHLLSHSPRSVPHH